MLISEKIARIIEQMLNEQNGTAEIQRNDFASRVGCVPSQINYVISSRFSKKRGYIVESRRGGGGYIKITRVRMQGKEYLMHMFATVGDSLDTGGLRSYMLSLHESGILNEKNVKIFAAMMSDDTLGAEEKKEKRDTLRADLFKTLLLNLM